MQFLARSIRPLLNSRAGQSWFLSQQYHHSTSSANKSSRGAEKRESVTPVKSSRPTEIPYQPKIANSVDLIGYVNQPIQFEAKLDGSYWAATVISDGPSSASGSDSDSTYKFWIPVIFDGDLAHTANCHLKKNDRIHISGHIFATPISGTNPDQAYVKVMARDLHYIECSKPLLKVLPATDHKEGVLKHSDSIQKRRNFGTDRWLGLLDKPDEWYDYRESKQKGSANPRHPDFKKKDGSVALWLTDAPSDILSNLKDMKFDIPVRSKYQKKQRGGEESWKDLVENMENWWDKRLDKKNVKAPDFKHKETGVGLWLDSCPSWVIERLPPSS